MDEPNETLTVTLSAPSYATVAYGSLWSRNANPTAITTGERLPNVDDIRQNLATTTSSFLTDRLVSQQVLVGVNYALTEGLSVGVKGRWGHGAAFRLSQEIGLNVAPAVELLGNSNDRASRCDEFINPRFVEIPGCGSGLRSTFSAMRLARRWSNGASWWRATNRRASRPTGSANTSGPAPVPPSPPSMAMQSTPRVPVARSGARSVQKVASPTAALLPTGSPIAAAMNSTKSSRASAFPKALGAVEMATGTGQTRTAVAFVKRPFEAGVVTRVLFLVDRIALAAQAEDAFTDHLHDDPRHVLCPGRRTNGLKQDRRSATGYTRFRRPCPCRRTPVAHH